MGAICSICDKKQNGKEEKYREPEQDPKNINVITVAANQGGTLEKEDQTTVKGKSTSAGTSVPGPSNDKKSSDEKSDDGKGTSQKSKDKKVKGKKEKRKADSSDTDSSDSDDMGYQKSSRKAYKNKHGGTTIVSKKVVVGGNYMNFEGAKNVTINNNSTPNPTKTEEKTRYEPYNDNTWRKSMAKGNFVYLPWASKGRLEGLDVSNLKVYVEKMICKIQYPGGSASGFRVGCKNRNLLCTAKHVLDKITHPDTDISVMGPPRHERVRNLERDDVWCIFNYVIDEHIVADADKFYFKPIIHFADFETDVAILELKDNQYGTAMPPPFARFAMPQANKPFYLIGHPNGGKKLSCLSEHLINMTSPVTSNHITKVRQWCKDNGGLQCEPAGYNLLNNPARWLFHVDENFTKGASGCPGLVIIPPHTVNVVTVLLRGYPDWFYDENIPLQTKALLPERYRVEQGANMQYVYQNMREKKPELWREIFNIKA